VVVGVLMTALSEQMKSVICDYCGNNVGGCVADVPYYAVTIYCKYFREDPLPARAHKRKFDLKKVLVETL
jgi:hypothetical protein